jgi:sulfonate transport system ATP-binding protein
MTKEDTMLLAPIQIETDFLSHFVQYDPASAPPQAPLQRRGVPLALTQLSKAYGERAVLNNVDLELEAGEFVAIVGRSGCGKSTLLRSIAGLESIDEGRIAIGSGVGAPDIRIMFQESRLLPWKTVLDNVALGLAPLSRRGGRLAVDGGPGRTRRRLAGGPVGWAEAARGAGARPRARAAIAAA